MYVKLYHDYASPHLPPVFPSSCTRCAAINVTSVATTLLTRKLKATGGHKYKRILSFLFIAVFSSILPIVITDVVWQKRDM